MESEGVAARFGYSVGTAGDVNGDGYSDVIVGALEYTNDQPQEGGAFVYLGSAGGLGLTPAWSVEGDQFGAQYGISVATAGDVDADGYADILVGANLYSNGQDGEGAAFLYLGSAGGPSVAPAWTAESDQVAAELGVSVASAGDVNADGYADVIVGAIRYDNGQTNEGRAFAYLGSAGGLAPVPAWTAEGDQPFAFFGFSASTAGDVNGDGYADVVVEASTLGRAFVYLGSAGGPGLAPAWTVDTAQAGSTLGDAVATAGDVNGDGHSDIIVGTPLYDGGQVDEGRALVYLGSPEGPGLAPAWNAGSGQAGALLGFSVAMAGDVDGDGYADVIVGAHPVRQWTDG